MRVSAIIPTHNRPAVLRSCLETLQTQDVDPAALEILVVDDGSTVDIDAVVAEVAASGLIPMRCERQELSGLNGARNRGAQLTHGDVLAFLDDDTLVAPGWARAVLGAFDARDCAALGGKVELRFARPAPKWLAPLGSYLAEYDLGPDARWIGGQDPVPVGANCAVRRSSFDQLGGFRRGLDRIGSSLVSNGDTDFFGRLRAAGQRMRYEPQALVAHCVPADRLTKRFFLKRIFAQGISDELVLADDGERVSWGIRLNHARFAARVAGWVGEDLVHGRRIERNLASLIYWIGRTWGHQPGRRLSSESKPSG